jgi:uncharacterized protein YjbJ (UPF0337 family)
MAVALRFVECRDTPDTTLTHPHEENAMTTREEIRGHWNELRGQIEQRWSQLSPHDLDEVEGDTDQLVGKIQQKTGQAKQKIEEQLDSLLDNLSQSASSATEKMGEYVKQAKDQFGHVSEAAREQYERASESIQGGYHQAEDMVRRRPAESVAVAFGTGLIAGVIVGLVLRR